MAEPDAKSSDEVTFRAQNDDRTAASLAAAPPAEKLVPVSPQRAKPPAASEAVAMVENPSHPDESALDSIYSDGKATSASAATPATPPKREPILQADARGDRRTVLEWRRK
jgi:hypothetical protein